MRVRINTHAGPIQAVFTDDWDTGTTLYEVTGARVSGVFAIAIALHAYDADGIDPDTPDVRVAMGRPTGQRYEQLHERTDRPVVNGVELCGQPVINTAKMRTGRLTRWNVRVRRGRGLGETPPATAERTVAVVEGLLTHWLTRPENYALRLAATRHCAAGAVTREVLDNNVGSARKALRAVVDELRVAKDRAAQGAVFAAMPPASYEGYGHPGVRPT